MRGCGDGTPIPPSLLSHKQNTCWRKARDLQRTLLRCTALHRTALNCTALVYAERANIAQQRLIGTSSVCKEGENHVNNQKLCLPRRRTPKKRQKIRKASQPASQPAECLKYYIEMTGGVMYGSRLFKALRKRSTPTAAVVPALLLTGVYPPPRWWQGWGWGVCTPSRCGAKIGERGVYPLRRCCQLPHPLP